MARFELQAPNAGPKRRNNTLLSADTVLAGRPCAVVMRPASAHCSWPQNAMTSHAADGLRPRPRASRALCLRTAFFAVCDLRSAARSVLVAMQGSSRMR